MKDPAVQRTALIALGVLCIVAGGLLPSVRSVLVPLGTGIAGVGIKAPGHDGEAKE